MFGRGICEKYQSRDEKFPEPNTNSEIQCFICQNSEKLQTHSNLQANISGK
jgi:hypothetical protein